MERLSRIQDGMNALISPDPLRRDFLGHERLLSTLYGAVKPDPAALEFASRVACVATVAGTIRSTLNPEPIDTSAVMNGITTLLDESITGHEIRESGPPPLDLSKINFEALAQRFQAVEAQEHGPRGAQGRHPQPARQADLAEPHAHGLRREVRGADRELQRRQPQHRGTIPGTARTCPTA
jgi:hypothetical protein